MENYYRKLDSAKRYIKSHITTQIQEFKKIYEDCSLCQNSGLVQMWKNDIRYAIKCNCGRGKDLKIDTISLDSAQLLGYGKYPSIYDNT